MLAQMLHGRKAGGVGTHCPRSLQSSRRAPIGRRRQMGACALLGRAAASFVSDLGLGDRGADVRQLQALLSSPQTSVRPLPRAL